MTFPCRLIEEGDWDRRNRLKDHSRLLSLAYSQLLESYRSLTLDKVHGIVEPSLKNTQYQLVGQGDVLFNLVQRLSKVLY
jgi:hypothetical protein